MSNKTSFLNGSLISIINLTMVGRIPGVNRLNYLNKKRADGTIRQIKRFKRIRLGDIILFILPLVILLVLIPPPRQEAIKPEEEKVEPVSKPYTKIIVYNNSASLVDEVSLEEYIAGVVAAEMPPEFHDEALKAQAVAARTFALSRKKGLYGDSSSHFGAHICTDPGHCQAWISKDRFLEVYGDEKDWNKIKKAVEETENMVMTYGGKLINPLYHSNSGGVTENIEAVWSAIGEVPYLKSVYSPDESQYSQYEKKAVFTWNEIEEKVKNKYPEAEIGSNPSKELEITMYSESGRAEEIRAGTITMSGTEFRELLSLRSTNIEISFPDKKTVEIISKGYGHGVGMSQCGADALGRKGISYIQILEHYYTGVNVEDLEQ